MEPRHVVPSGWWQAAQPLGGYAYVGATVGPGFDFADFSFARGCDAADRIARLRPGAGRVPLIAHPEIRACGTPASLRHPRDRRAFEWV
ncbi:MAG: cupin domain-containing protein [Burkholderiales bacterium]|nr:cupin domain-containing protein [Burkholderiales bacterium]